MALSNWDTLAVNEKGESIGGSFKSPGGVTVEFYKNWLYVRDPKAWDKSSGYTKPTIMQVNSGDFSYKDIHIMAVRGPKGGIYAAVWTSKYQEQSKEKGAPYIPPIVTGMVGIGCYGFLNEVDLVLAKLGRTVQPGDCWISSSTNSGPDHTWVSAIENLREDGKRERIEHEKYDLDELWVGVEPAEVQFLKDKLINDEEYGADIPDEFKKIDFSKAARFNQGDQFFANAMGQETPATEPGKAEGTIFGKVLKNI